VIQIVTKKEIAQIQNADLSDFQTFRTSDNQTISRQDKPSQESLKTRKAKVSR